MRWRTMLALLCACLTIGQSCLAFSDTAAKLDAAEGLTLTVSGLTLRQMTGSENGRETLNAFLSPLSASAALKGETARLAFLSKGTEIAALRMDEAGQADAFELPYITLSRVFSEVLPALFDAGVPEEGLPEPEQRTVNIRNVGKSTQRTTLTISPAQANAAESALSAIQDIVARLSGHLPHSAELVAWTEGLSAVSNLTLKRLENEEGKAVAWSMTGRIASGGKDARNLNLYSGVSGMNVYVSLKLPARSGKNSLELVIDLKAKTGKKKNTWSGTVSYKRAMNGDSYTVKDTVDLENDHASGERITGSLKRELTLDGIKSVWTVKPDLTGDGHSMKGTVTATKKHAQTQVWQASFTVSLAEGASVEEPAAETAQEFTALLLGYLNEYRASLSADEQRQLDHMLRTDDWMNGLSK